MTNGVQIFNKTSSSQMISARFSQIATSLDLWPPATVSSLLMVLMEMTFEYRDTGAFGRVVRRYRMLWSKTTTLPTTSTRLYSYASRVAHGMSIRQCHSCQIRLGPIFATLSYRSPKPIPKDRALCISIANLSRLS
eukprot:COSAG02_NODE_8260_length_2639_cov_1.019291_3_plen_136_part_00